MLDAMHAHPRVLMVQAKCQSSPSMALMQQPFVCLKLLMGASHTAQHVRQAPAAQIAVLQHHRLRCTAGASSPSRIRQGRRGRRRQQPSCLPPHFI